MAAANDGYSIPGLEDIIEGKSSQVEEDDEDFEDDADLSPSEDDTITVYSAKMDKEYFVQRHTPYHFMPKGRFGILKKAFYDDDQIVAREFQLRDPEHYELVHFVRSCLKISEEHENVVTVLDVITPSLHGTTWYIMSEYCNRARIGRYLYFEESSYFWVDAVPIAYQLASGLKFLHDKSIIHGDIKPTNILVDTKAAYFKAVKLADYRLTACLDPNDLLRPEYKQYYKAPEFWRLDLIDRHRHRTKEADIFSLALVLLAVMQYKRESKTLKPPNAEGFTIGEMNSCIGYAMSLRHKINGPKLCVIRSRPCDPPFFKMFVLLLQEMTAFNPEDRPAVDQILEIIENIQIKPLLSNDIPILEDDPEEQQWSYHGVFDYFDDQRLLCFEDNRNIPNDPYPPQKFELIRKDTVVSDKEAQLLFGQTEFHNVIIVNIKGKKNLIAHWGINTDFVRINKSLNMFEIKTPITPDPIPDDPLFLVDIICKGPDDCLVIVIHNDSPPLCKVVTTRYDEGDNWKFFDKWILTGRERPKVSSMGYLAKSDAILLLKGQIIANEFECRMRHNGLKLWAWKERSKKCPFFPSYVAVNCDDRLFVADFQHITELDPSTGRHINQTPLRSTELMPKSRMIKSMAVSNKGGREHLLVSTLNYTVERVTTYQLYEIMIPEEFELKSLYELCRDVILRCACYGGISYLPLSKCVIKFLRFEN